MPFFVIVNAVACGLALKSAVFAGVGRAVLRLFEKGQKKTGPEARFVANVSPTDGRRLRLTSLEQ